VLGYSHVHRHRSNPHDQAAAFGAKATVIYYANHVVVDNEVGKVNIEE
jgi:hypothetical protein